MESIESFCSSSKKRLERFYNAHENGSIIIVANGPSLNHTNFELVKNSTCIGLNKIFLGFHKFCFYPRYYIAVNSKVIGQSLSQINHLNCVKFLSSHGSHQLLKEDALTYFINTSDPPTRFSSDPSQGVHEGSTVTYVALQLAFFMGARKVGLIGLDHQYSYTGEPHESKLLEGADTNHFCDDYFGYGQYWDNPALEEAEESFFIARQVFEQHGRHIVDCTPNGKCSVFEKGRLEDFVNQN